jgi:hypothetical protein
MNHGSDTVSSSGFLSRLHVLPSANSISTESAFEQDSQAPFKARSFFDAASSPAPSGPRRASATFRPIYTLPSSIRGSITVDGATLSRFTMPSEADTAGSHELPHEVHAQLPRARCSGSTARCSVPPRRSAPRPASVVALPPQFQRHSAPKSIFAGTGTQASVAEDDDNDDDTIFEDARSAKADTWISAHLAESVWDMASTKKHWTRSLSFLVGMGIVLLAAIGLVLGLAAHPTPGKKPSQSLADSLSSSATPRTSRPAQGSTTNTFRNTTSAAVRTNPLATVTGSRRIPTSSPSPQAQLPSPVNVFDFSSFAQTTKPFQGIAYQP